VIHEQEKRRDPGRPAVSEVPLELQQALKAREENRAIALFESHPALVHFRVPVSRLTLLHVASARLLPRAVAWQLDHGADANAPTADGSTPLDVVGLACDIGERATVMEAVVHLLRGRGAELTPRSAILVGDDEFLRARLAEGGLAAPQDDQGWLLRLAVDCDRRC
jgi:hypothetical protein